MNADDEDDCVSRLAFSFRVTVEPRGLIMSMKSSVMLAAVALLALTAGDIKAQDANISLNVDSVAPSPQLQHTPALVIHEIAIPAQKTTVPDAGPGLTPSKKGSAKATQPTAGATPIQASIVQAPIFMPGPVSPNTASEMSTTGNPKYDELVAQSATRNQVDPNLMIAVMRQESGFNPRARSYKGATGLMQLMPATAQRFGVTNVYDAAQNIEGGAKYLRFLLDTFNGDVDLVLAGYNAGEHAVVNSGYRIPRYRETQNYVRSITARYDKAKNRGGHASRVAVAPVAPNAETFANGRLSNNY